MKKLLALFLVLASATAFANSRQNVSIFWPFSVGSNQVNFVRAIIDEANNQQNKYQFVVEFKAGAGGTVAAQHVARAEQLTLLTSSSSFFVRPVYYPNESHKIEDFRPIYIECTGQPMSILSVKYKTLDELRKQKRLTIGVGLGSITESAARELQKHLPNTQLDLIPYGGTFPAVQDMLGGTLDLAAGWIADTRQFVEIGKAYSIGITGTKDLEGYKTFHSQKVRGFEELVGNYAVMASKRVSDQQAEELHNILRKGAQASTRLNGYYYLDVCTPADLNWKQTQDIYKRWQQYWPEKLNK
jgi:tripartite-type tricarboxylate transporter receptor subunit TctC